MPTDTSIWTTLWPVIVGGTIGVAGSFLNQWFIERRKERNEKSKMRGQKIEELVNAVYEFDHWLEKYRNERAYGESLEIGISPLAKMEAIAATHFPDFLKSIHAVDVAAAGYQVAIAESAKRRLAGKITEINDGLMEARQPYAQKRDELLDDLKSFARDQLK